MPTLAGLRNILESDGFLKQELDGEENILVDIGQNRCWDTPISISCLLRKGMKKDVTLSRFLMRELFGKECDFFGIREK